ncbi:MAG: cobalt-precorrin 5A hydrolase [Desulfocucumaceae bacterium]
MKIAVMAVTRKGTELGLRVAEVLRAGDHDCQVFTLPEISAGIKGASPLQGQLSSVVGDFFSGYRGLVMIMALGIVVRTIAPHIRDKRKDPAVVALDEGGNFAISVLSGHVGGANELAGIIASGLGARAVITTATDVAGVPAIDVLARDFKLEPDPSGAIKKFNAALARGEKVYIYSEYNLPLTGTECLHLRPWELLVAEKAELRALVTGRIDIFPRSGELVLRPRNLVAGVGCKKGCPASDIIREVVEGIKSAGRSLLCLSALATISEKASEEGIIAAAEALGVPLRVFGKEEIKDAIEKYGLSSSQFVEQKMGVGGVCEPAAMLACRKGRLLAAKIKGPGVTVAVAEEEYGWWA